MKAEVETVKLQRALKNVQRAMSKSYLPVLDNILIEAIAAEEEETGGILRLTATDLELTIRQEVEACVVQAGSTTTPGGTLSQLASTLEADSVALSLGKGETLTVKAGSTCSRLKGIPASEYPAAALSAPAAGVTTQVAAEALSAAIEVVALAADKEDNRPPLHGVHLKAAHGRLTLTAADGYRAAQKTIAAGSGVAFETTIPARALRELQRIIAKAEDAVSIRVMDDQAAFTCGEVCLRSAAITIPYPDISRVVPQARQTRIIADLPSLEQAAKQAALFSDAVRLQADGGDAITVSAQSAELGKNSVSLSARIEGQAVAFGLNVRYLTSLLKAAKAAGATGEVIVDLAAPDRPVVFQFPAIAEYQHIIMPILMG